MINKVLIDFAKYTDGDFESKARTIITNMTGNAAFPTPSPTLLVVTGATDDYSEALAAASTGNRSDVADKNEKRQALTVLLRSLASYINFTAAGDRAVLLTTGFNVSKEKEPIIITKPWNLQVTNGMNAGDLHVSVRAVKGARSYVHEYTNDTGLAAGNWESTTSSQSKITFSGLEAGKTYHCRVAAVGTKGQLVYSDTLSRIVI